MAAKKPEAEAEAPKKKGKLLIIVSALVVVLGGGGGAAWFFLRPSDANAHVEKPKAALFLPLETFTVNLVPSGGEGQPEFVQAGLTLKVEEQETIDQIKERMPLVRDRILMVLSGKKSADLLPVAGKRKLAEEIAAAVQGVITPEKPAKKKAKAKAEEEESEEAKDAKEAKEAKEGKEGKGEEEAKADDEAGEGEPKKAKAKAKAKGPKAPVVEVLFTAFMIQ